MPEESNTNFVVAIESLIREVEAIVEQTNPYKDFSYGHDYKTHESYHSWLRKLRKYFDIDDLSRYLSPDFFFAQDINLPRPPILGIDKMRDEEYFKELREFRAKFHDALVLQIAELKRIKSDLENRTVRMQIFVESNALIWREPRSTFSYQSSKSAKRFRMFKLIAESHDHVKTKTLINKLSYDSRGTLAGEKREFNETLCKHLGLTQDVIYGGNQTHKKGYTINPYFEVKIIKSRR